MMRSMATSVVRGAAVGVVAGAVVTFVALRGLGYRRDHGDRSLPVSAVTPAAMPLPGQSAAELAEVVAQLDGAPITVGRLQLELNAQLPALRARYQDPEKKKAFLVNLIRTEVQVAEAQRRQLQRDPDVVRTANQVMIKRLVNELELEVKPEDVTETELRAYYDQHPLEFNTPAKVRVSAILVKDRAVAERVAQSAKGVDTQAFRELVAKHSVDEPSRQRGGDLQYFSADATTAPRAVIVAAFELVRTGDVAGPVATKDGFYLIQQTGRLPARSQSFEDVRSALQQRFYRDKRAKALDDFVTGLVTAAKVRINDAALAKVRIDTADHAPPANAP